MSLRIRQLQLRVQTGEGLFGTHIAFSDGLVLLRAENTMGKSTCVQAIIYALGLERMLGPSSAIPLPHVMTAYLDDGQKDLQVLESEVLLEIENNKGEFLTIQRPVVGGSDTRLVSTWEGARLTNPTTSFPKRDYYVRDAGSAQNEAGFLHKLAEFVGWQLPTVRRFNGSECPLYLEAICPLFIVEQKHGWSGIQANLPTYFAIREMARQFPQQTRAQIHDLGLQNEVIWIDRYLALDELVHYIQAADIGLVTYTEPDQISTGILTMMLGCGRPVVATNFDGAKSAARLVDGVYLAEINQPESICAKIHEVIRPRERLLQLMHTTYSQTRPWLWKSSGSSYRRVFEQAVRTCSEQ